jgi:hypothetical protein
MSRRNEAETHVELPPGANEAGMRGVSPAQPVSSGGGEPQVNIIDKSDDEILAMSDPLWRDLVKYSNEGKYGEFVKKFSTTFALAMNQVVVGNQHVTVLYRQRSTKKEGEWLGRLVLGYENGEVRIFGASIF